MILTIQNIHKIVGVQIHTWSVYAWRELECPGGQLRQDFVFSRRTALDQGDVGGDGQCQQAKAHEQHHISQQDHPRCQPQRAGVGRRLARVHQAGGGGGHQAAKKA